MDVLITGVPVRFWIELRGPLRKRVESLMEAYGAPYGDEVGVMFFGAYGIEAPLRVAFDMPKAARKWQMHLRLEVAFFFEEHARKYAWNYKGVLII